MSAVAALPMSFTPQLRAADALAASWLTEVTSRLRREIAWMWYQRGGAQPNSSFVSNSTGTSDTLPPLADSVIESLDLARYADDKQRFFTRDVTARYLSEQIAAVRDARAVTRGPWATVVARLHLDDAAQLTLALALAARADSACGAIFGACHNDLNKTLPTLALAQRLHDDAASVLALDSAHPLFRYGLLSAHGDHGHSDHGRGDWQQGYEMAPAIARAFLTLDGALPSGLAPLPLPIMAHASDADFAATLKTHATAVQLAPTSAEWLPLIGDDGADFAGWAAQLAASAGRPLLRVADARILESPQLTSIAAWCWLHDVDVLLPPQAPRTGDHAHERAPAWPATPVRWWAPLADAAAARSLPANATLPSFVLPKMSYSERATRLHATLAAALGNRARGLDRAVEEIARRFRFEAATIDSIATAAAQLEGPVGADALEGLCRARAQHDMGALAQRVTPRFTLHELVLPAAQTRQLQEIVRAMRALTRVHYRWGTARAWNDAGLSVLFCGAPGTGKTMGAEALAYELQLPMYRIDLSQVVNKYIGETEKNLRRVFDAAEASDCVLFFDEADALFGKRTDVKDAHDRFANIEISYLLERMERFKGIAVLATNRRKDLDEAFMRRLRYVIEFPLPGIAERERIWRQVFPREVDASALDVAYLARQFTLAGGHIRSIAFNACLQAADPQELKAGKPKIDMQPVLGAIKRELDKLNRPLTLEAFGNYRDLVAPLFAEATL